MRGVVAGLCRRHPIGAMTVFEDTSPTTGSSVQKRQTARLSVISNAALTVLKLIVVSMSGSISVLAETVNSVSDLFGSAVAYGAVRAADSPPDRTHEYGHGKFENLSGMVIGIFILGGGAFALAGAIQHLVLRQTVRQTTAAIAVMAVSAGINLLVSRRLVAVGRKLDSPALLADGKHLRTDVITSCTALASLVLTHFTGQYWIDPLAAIGITVLIFYIAIQIMRDAIMTLLDASLPEKEEQMLRDALDSDSRVLGYHKLRTRKSGSQRHVDVHVQIDDSHTFVEAHDFTEQLEEKLRATLPNVHPIIHTEPFEAEARHQEAERRRQEKLRGDGRGD
jgi:cation diffusion facilitator family transporter